VLVIYKWGPRITMIVHEAPHIPNTTMDTQATPRSYSTELPVELLSYIFSFLPYISGNICSPEPPWVAIMRVCRYWRGVSLQCCDLWRVVPLGHPKWTQAALQLSEPRSLHIVFPTGKGLTSDSPVRIKDAVRLALSSAHRACVMELRLDGVDDPDEREDLLNALNGLRADSLVELNVFHHMQYPLLPSLFSSGIDPPPNLRRLTLHSCFYEKNFPAFGIPLTSLKISHSYARCSIQAFIPVLASLAPSLENLVIENSVYLNGYYNYTDAAVVPSGERILFPQMRNVEIRGRYHIVLELLNYFDFPPCAEVAIACTKSPDSPSNVPSNTEMTLNRLTDMFAYHLRKAIDAGVHFDAVHHHRGPSKAAKGRTSYVVTAKSSPHEHTGLIPKRFTFEIEWSPDMNPLIPLKTLYSIIPAISRSRVLRVGPYFDSDDWTLLFKATPHAQEIQFDSMGCLPGFPSTEAVTASAQYPEIERISFKNANAVDGRRQEDSAMLVQLLQGTPDNVLVDFPGDGDMTFVQKSSFDGWRHRIRVM